MTTTFFRNSLAEVRKLAFAAIAVGSFAVAAVPSALDHQFKDTVRPVVMKYCAGCHSGSQPAAQFDLKSYDSMETVVRDYPRWALVLKRVAADEMPPKQLPQPTDEERKKLTGWIQAVRTAEIRKNAGDPGPVLARRLSNAEYNNVIRDLTGVDLRPAKEFPTDPANQAGFDNSGESLTVSPSLMSKYMDAARLVADHLVLDSTSLAFSRWPALVETDRERYSVQSILDFYKRQPTDFADYFEAAWQYKHRMALGKPRATLAGVAANSKVSPRYLPLVWQALEQKEEIGPLAKLQTMWRNLPAPKSSREPDSVKAECVQMRDYVVRIRRHTEKLFDPPTVAGMNANFQPFVMWRNREIEKHRLDFDRAALRVAGEPAAPELVVTRGPIFGGGEKITVEKAIADYQKERKEDPDLAVPAGQRARYEAAFSRFSSVFPTAFYLPERGRFYPVDSYDQGRYLGAGFHSNTGYFRDDAILSDLILDEASRKDLDKLWHDFDFVANYTGRTWEQFLFNGGGGRGMRIKKPAFDASTSGEAILGIRDQYVKLVPADKPEVAKAITEHFDDINTKMRWLQQARSTSEPLHLNALLKFAAMAYRRPLAADERTEILSYYHELRDTSKLSHEEAIRASIVSVLVSPDFLYRVDSLGNGAHSLTKSSPSVPLSGFELANRLSFFLWSTMPDQELTAHAAAGDLANPAVLAAEVRRMVKDEKIFGLATEFVGNWLGFRGFTTLNSVDRERFPMFNDQLRTAMFEEPIRYFVDLLRTDHSALDLLYGDYAIINPVLAKHYGMPELTGGPDHWVRVDHAGTYGRGGILPMSVFLTMNAPGLRTSPVKRGYWVARRVLGEVVPPPPAVVPELPHDEAKSDLPIRDLLAQHRQNPMCASCHARFDTFGLTMENYGPVGDRRTKDLAGRPVDLHALFPGGTQGEGIEGLKTYIHAHREGDFLNNLSEKMLAYALERSLQISDEPLLATMRTQLSANNGRISSLIETIVTSPQFLNRRNSPYRREQSVSQINKPTR